MPSHYTGTEEEKRALGLFIKLMRAADSVATRVSHRTGLGGLTPTQFGVLEALLHLGPLSPCQLAAKHLMSRNNLSVVIKNLERDGLIYRVPDPNDRRAHVIHLTDNGRTRIEAAFPPHVEAVVAEMQALSPEQQEQLGALLRQLGRGAKDPDG